MSFPARHTVMVLVRGEPVEDRFGNLWPGEGQWVPVRVIGWAIGTTSELAGEHVLRDELIMDLFTPDSVQLGADSRVRLPDSSEWDVQGAARDYRHGPWWNPQALVYSCRRVEG